MHRGPNDELIPDELDDLSNERLFAMAKAFDVKADDALLTFTRRLSGRLLTRGIAQSDLDDVANEIASELAKRDLSNVKFEAALNQITKSKVADWQRKLCDNREHTLAVAEQVASSRPYVDAEARDNLLWQGIDELPADQRQVIELLYFPEHVPYAPEKKNPRPQYAKVARQLKIEPKEVRRLEREALATLRKNVACQVAAKINERIELSRRQIAYVPRVDHRVSTRNESTNYLAREYLAL